MKSVHACAAVFSSFFKIGLFTLGGGYAMLPLIEREVVDRRGWLDGRDFLDALAVAQSLPGPVAVNTATFVGYRVHGLKGALAAVFGATLPSFLVMIAVAACFMDMKDDPGVVAVFAGLRPAVAALVAASAWSLAVRARLDWRRGLLALAAALAVWRGGMSPAWIAVVLAALGAAFPGKIEGRGAGDAADG